jgi:imidazolonepropionase-like amidohydrolase
MSSVYRRRLLQGNFGLSRHHSRFVPLIATVSAFSGLLAGCGVATFEDSEGSEDGEVFDVGEGCVALENGRVFLTGNEGLSALTLLVYEGEVRGLLSLDAPIPADCESIDLHGAAVVPGLIDAHVHVTMSSTPGSASVLEVPVWPNLQANLRSGVTSFIDLGGPSAAVFELRDRLEQGEVPGPRPFVAGPFLTASGGHPCPVGVAPGDRCALIDTVADVDAAWSQLGPLAPDVIKVAVGPLEVEVMAAVVDRARAAGIPVIAHVIREEEVHKALDAGIRVFAHAISAEAMPAALVERLAGADAVVIPTVVAFENAWRAATGSLEEPGMDGIEDDIPAWVLETFDDPQALGSTTSPEYQELTRRYRAQARASTMQLMDAGVKLLAGSDAGVPGAFAGLALVHELELLVELGMSPADALEAATHGPAQLLGREDLGRIEVGAIADLLVVQGDPTRDVSALRNVVAVYRAGVPVDLEALAIDVSPYAFAQLSQSRREPGQVCFDDSECKDDSRCIPGLVRCRERCEVGSSACNEASACFGHPVDGGYCHPGDGCDPLAQDCLNGAACIWVGNGATLCNYASDTPNGEGCGDGFSCAQGAQCDWSDYVCRALCDPHAADGGCPQGTECIDLSPYAGVAVGECM